MTNQRKPFKIEFDHKRDFRKWVLEQFPAIRDYASGLRKEYPEFRERIPEVDQALSQVFEIIRTRSDQATQNYYLVDMLSLEDARRERNPRLYAITVDLLVEAIEWE